MSAGTLPGTAAEKRVVKELRGYLGDIADWVNEVRFPVIAWEEVSCAISVNGAEVSCALNPYFNGDAEVEGSVYIANNFSELGKCGDICALRVSQETDVFALRLAVGQLLLREDISAILLAFEGPLKRFAFTYSSVPMDMVSSPPPKPVASIPAEALGSIRSGCRARAAFSARAREGEGVTLVAGLNGSGEDVVHVTAHHDRFFEGSGHSSVGLKALGEVLRRASGEAGLPNLVLVSYSAKELGDRELTAYNFSWGSRYFLRLLDQKGELERVRACVNVDDIYEAPGLMIVPGLEGLAEELIGSGAAGYFGYSHAGFDSLIYNMLGVPAVTLTSMPGRRSRELYNSVADNSGSVEVERLAALSADIVTHIIKRDPRGLFSAERAYSSLVNLFGEAPSYVRFLVSRLARGQLGVSPRELLRSLFGLSFVIKGASEIDVRTNFLADLILLSELARSPPAGRALIASLGEVIIDIYSKGDEALDPVVEAMERLALRYNDVINKIAELIICKQLYRRQGAGLEHCVGEHR